MGHALVLEIDSESCTQIADLLRSLGYTAAPVRTPYEAIEVASALKIDVVVTYTCQIPNDRRALTGELRRAAPEAAVILIGEGDTSQIEATAGSCPGLSAVVTRPISIAVLRDIIALQVCTVTSKPGYRDPWKERRRQYS